MANEMRFIEVERKCLSYEELDAKMRGLEFPQLSSLLNSRTTKVGDTAASLLIERGICNELVDAMLNGCFTSKKGKIRALNVLNSFGCSCPRSHEGYKLFVLDRDADVVVSALFGLVFLQDLGNLTYIRQAMAKAEAGSTKIEFYNLAIQALKEGNPFIYSPHFHDRRDVWGIDKNRFGHRVGSFNRREG